VNPDERNAGRASSGVGGAVVLVVQFEGKEFFEFVEEVLVRGGEILGEAFELLVHVGTCEPRVYSRKREEVVEIT